MEAVMMMTFHSPWLALWSSGCVTSSFICSTSLCFARMACRISTDIPSPMEAIADDFRPLGLRDARQDTLRGLHRDAAEPTPRPASQ